MRVLSCVLLLVCVFLLFLATAQAATYYVSPTGSGACRTSRSSPGGGIAATLGCMSSGDTLYLRAGTYDETLTSDQGLHWPSGSSWVHATTLAGDPQDPPLSAILAPTSGPDQATIQLGGSHDIIFNNLVIDNAQYGTGTGTKNGVKTETDTSHIRFSNGEIRHMVDINLPHAVAGMLVAGDGHQILNMAIHDNVGYAIYLHATNSLVKGCRFYNNGRMAIQVYDDLGNINNNILDSNVFHDNGFHSPGCYSGCFQPGFIMGSGSNNVARNNLVYNNGDGGMLMINGCTNCAFQNNTVVGNQAKLGTAGIVVSGGSTGTVVNNISYHNAGGDSISGGSQHANLVGTNPHFVDETQHDYHLQTGSPAIGAGTDLSATFTTDFAGATRTVPWSIGAYTAGGGPSIPTATLTARPPSIPAGAASTLTWSSSNATSCAGSGFSTGGVTSGSLSVSPTVTTPYAVTCTGAGGSATANATVAVSLPSEGLLAPMNFHIVHTP